MGVVVVAVVVVVVVGRAMMAMMAMTDGEAQVKGRLATTFVHVEPMNCRRGRPRASQPPYAGAAPHQARHGESRNYRTSRSNRLESRSRNLF